MGKSIEILEGELRYAQSTEEGLIREVEGYAKRIDELTAQIEANHKVIEELKDGLEALRSYQISNEVREKFIRMGIYRFEPDQDYLNHEKAYQDKYPEG